MYLYIYIKISSTKQLHVIRYYIQKLFSTNVIFSYYRRNILTSRFNVNYGQQADVKILRQLEVFDKTNN